MTTVTAKGAVRSPLPMNPASRVYPVLNANVTYIRYGAWAHTDQPEQFETRKVETGKGRE